MVWVEVSDEADLAQWACDCAHNGPLACVHVAATLSAWIAHPTDFATIGAEASDDAEPESARTLPPPTTSLAQPTQTSPGARAAPSADSMTLASALARMNAADVDVIARRILSPTLGHRVHASH